MKSLVSLVMWIPLCRAGSRRRGTASLRIPGPSRSRFASLSGIYRPSEGRDIRDAKIAARMQGRIVRRTMLQQEAMIERTRSVCRVDEHLAAAMMYGSFARAEGDGFSAIEFKESLWHHSGRGTASLRPPYSWRGAVPRPSALLAWRDRGA